MSERDFKASEFADPRCGDAITVRPCQTGRGPLADRAQRGQSPRIGGEPRQKPEILCTSRGKKTIIYPACLVSLFSKDPTYESQLPARSAVWSTCLPARRALGPHADRRSEPRDGG